MSDLDGHPTDIMRRLLDHLGQQPGSLIVRGPKYWQALPPGKIGQVLAIGDDNMPGWYWPDDLPGGNTL